MTSYIQRFVQRHASVLLLFGLFVCLCGLLFLSLCSSMSDKPKQAEQTSAYRERSLWPMPTETFQKSTYLVVLVLSSPAARVRRDTIRQTWLSNLPIEITRYFAISTHQLSSVHINDLNAENRIHEDLLLLPELSDDYRLLTEKLLHAFVWLDNHIDFKFVFKADDDTFARVDMLYDALSLQYRKETMLYWGFFTGNAHVQRQGQWAEMEWNICDRYVPYARGGGYVLSASLVHFLALNHNVLKRYNSEDVSVGAWLATLNLNRIHDPRFDTEYKSRGCNNRYIVTHKQSTDMMNEKSENLRTTGRLCSQEVRYAKSYIYNWNVLPSKCCVRNLTTIP